METQPGSSGILGSVREFADGLVGSLHDRIELLAVELHEEKHRFVQIAIWVMAVVFLALLTLIFASIALIVVFWDTARVAVTVTIAAVYLIGFIASAIGLRRFLSRQPTPFAATLRELREDRTCMRIED